MSDQKEEIHVQQPEDSGDAPQEVSDAAAPAAEAEKKKGGFGIPHPSHPHYLPD